MPIETSLQPAFLPQCHFCSGYLECRLDDPDVVQPLIAQEDSGATLCSAFSLQDGWPNARCQRLICQGNHTQASTPPPSDDLDPATR